MTKEIYISSTPHETRLAVVEDDQLAEIYYERENEYTLAGSVYKGKVTRVLPGMQSAFVDIGLERDAFLYVTDFAEEQEDGEEYVALPAPGQGRGQSNGQGRERRPEARAGEGRGDGRSQDRSYERSQDRSQDGGRPAAAVGGLPQMTFEPAAGTEREETEDAAGEPRKWRGRRGRRRGRGGSGQGRGPGNARNGAADGQPFAPQSEQADEPFELEAFDETAEAAAPAMESAAPAEPRREREPEREREAVREREPGRQRDATHSRPAEAAAFVLPGESLSKYRRGQQPPTVELAPAARPAAAPVVPTPSFQPSTMVTGPIAWDGSGVLPGESLSRHKKRPNQGGEAGPSTPLRSGGDDSFSAGEAGSSAALNSERGTDFESRTVASSVAAEAGPVESAPAVSFGAEETAAPAGAHPIHEHPLVEHPVVAHPIGASAEAEPEEGSASYRFDPVAPSEYRQSGFVAETEEQTVTETASIGEPEDFEQAYRGPEEHGAKEIMPEEKIPVDGPRVERMQDPFFGEAASLIEPRYSSPKAFSSQSGHSPAEHTPEAEAGEQQEYAEDRSTEEDVEEHAAAEGDDAESRVFNPGDGELEEETIDEEEPDTLVMQSLVDDENYDDLVEETLDMQMDSGLLSELVRDRHVDRRTQFQESDGAAAEEDSFDEPGMGFGEEHSGLELEEIGEDEESEETAAPDAARPRTGGDRGGRRGVRGQRNGQGGGRRDGRMRRSTAQTSNLPAITELLKPNQEILVQIAKEPIARKGARITSHIALPGRFLVFMPTVNHVGVSRKIASDEERQRLKHILLSEKGAAAGGFIVRTAAASASEEDLRADIRFLLTLWAEIKQRADSAKPPALIYHDLSLVERVLRDQVTDNFSAIWVDSEQDYERVLRFLNRFEPSLVRRVKLYTKETPLFEQFGIQEEINKALRSKVWLKSGGSIVINQTEALVAIDINTGKYVGKTARLEDTILKTNLDAIPEIVRQIRLRDLGGIIVIDFIDMDERKNRNRVMQVLEEALKSDRAPSKVLQFNDFGLVAITRKRVKQSLERTLSVPCNTCQGTGMVKGPLTVCNEIYIELRKMHKQLDRGDVLLRVNPEVVKQLKAGNGRWLTEMEEMSRKTVIVKSDPSLHPEQFDLQ